MTATNEIMVDILGNEYRIYIREDGFRQAVRIEKHEEK